MREFSWELLNSHATPYYLYDKELLDETLDALAAATAGDSDFCVHYAVKANDNPAVLSAIARRGLGADCVSGGEIAKAIAAGFDAGRIVFAGVGKKDEEIEFAIRSNIYSLNVESIQELEVINDIALRTGCVAPIALRVNPNVDAHTHANITTGMEENKFGIALGDVIPTIRLAETLRGVRFTGLHFHIGSQVTEFDCFVRLCSVINDLQSVMECEGIRCEMIDVGGGLGIDYDAPAEHPVPDFGGYFAAYRDNLRLRGGQRVHFELGRSVVAQCGSLITRVLFEKATAHKQFVIVDAGFTDLVRPALYDAHHHIDNLSSTKPPVTYDVVGPICESSDVFAKSVSLPETHRGDMLAIRSAGAYGEVMASAYNARPLIKGYLE